MPCRTRSLEIIEHPHIPGAPVDAGLAIRREVTLRMARRETEPDRSTRALNTAAVTSWLQFPYSTAVRSGSSQFSGVHQQM
jgi:hypothetical protein